MKNTKNANNQDKFKALKLAEIQMTDKEDFENCVSDLVRNASLNSSEAKLVASAIRSKYLPNMLRESGLSEMVNLDEDLEKEDFAKESDEDENMEMHHFESDEEDEDMNEDMSEDEMMEDEDEVEDEDTATFEIEVPADMVDAARQAVQEALDNLLGEDNDSDVDMEDENEMDLDEDMETEDEVEEMESDDEMETEEDDSEAKMHKSSNKVNKMTKQALAARRAEREEILKRLASEEKYPASANFKYNEDMVNMPGETEYPTFKFQGENSLREDNFSYADQKVPTLNNLDDHPGLSSSKFEGTPSGDLEYVCDWDALENPSEGLDATHPEIPTEMPMEHNTSGPASVKVAGKSQVECVDCGHRMALSDEEMQTASCPNCDRMAKKHKSSEDEEEDDDVKATTVKLPQTGVNVPPGSSVNITASLDTARIKTAYSCSSKLALAGIIETSEVDSYAEQMLNDNLKADAMIRQTKLLLKSAQASTERVAAAAAERINNVRTASTMGISTSPAFSGSVPANGAALDIQSALKGTWTMPQIED